MRCVFDTNAIISAMLSNTATPGVALARAYDSGEILVSVPLSIEVTVRKVEYDLRRSVLHRTHPELVGLGRGVPSGRNWR